MGLFDFFKSKTPEEKKLEKFLKIREKSKVKEKKSLMHSLITMAPHDNSLNDENPEGVYFVEVYNMTGRKVLKSKSSPLFMESLPKGIYLVRVHSKHKTTSSKIIKE